MDTVVWAIVQDKLSGIFTGLIGEEVHLSEEEARRVIERLCAHDVSSEKEMRSFVDPVSVG
jgi:hypothetical protein